ncbi:related to Prefoldin subunit 5 [Saccharomycodes ludwigii]|uniref:Related to Prefoldin subunit 5 n=1 Tax=Saccharomycodes ludwigii TaxID=36035 RepID=A0A376B6H8_9ASCO|nr:related to Prefoldin subunit 5 [Saccharomycodes ludwigii]
MPIIMLFIQFDQELQHFSQSLQALNIARDKFKDCIDDVNAVSNPENENNPILIPLSNSLYAPGQVKDCTKFMVDIGTGYFIEKTTKEAINFYQGKVEKLNKESQQIQSIIKEKSMSSIAIENRIRQLLIEKQKQQPKE